MTWKFIHGSSYEPYTEFKGKVTLEALPELPREIATLWTIPKLIDDNRAYNNVLALASIGCKVVNMPGYIPTFKVQGKLYHSIGSLMPGETETNDTPKFAQLFFVDTDEHELVNKIKHLNDL